MTVQFSELRALIGRRLLSRRGWFTPHCGLILAALVVQPAWSQQPTARPQDSARRGPGRAADSPSNLPRNSDRRQRPDAAALAQLGILRYESRRLILYTDVSEDQAKPLPGMLDAAFDAWESYFGALPADRERSDYQLTGYLMADQRLFRDAGVLPDDLPAFDHGRHRGQEFWLNEQPTAYYREHLLLHEGTHCYMTSLEHGLLKHTWYMEGMAEHFGTHRRNDEGRVDFRVLPTERSAFPGLGRIRLIEEHVAGHSPPSLRDVVDLAPERFREPDAYAWSWALCQFLDHHHQHAERFRAASRPVVEGGADGALRKLLDDPAVAREWVWFATDLCHGYDRARAALEIVDGTPLTDDNSAKVTIRADRGWQSSTVRLEAGKRYRVTASGRFVLARAPKPWVSEPQGVSIRYLNHHPLGRLLGRIWPADLNARGNQRTLDLGRDARIVPESEGTLYLRLNDAWSELDDNQGEIEVVVREEK